MSKKVLVLGGTRFFGLKLVNKLLEANMVVTITTRGNNPNPFGDQVTHLIVDRENKIELQKTVGDTYWDVVYDNICYASKEALEACDIFEGKVGKYIVTSTLSVYGLGTDMKEEEVDTATMPIKMGSKEDFSYQEGKQMAEAVFFQKADFPVAAMRIPIVMGQDDYTDRLKFHIEHVLKEIPMQVGGLETRMAYINSDEAAEFLFWLGQNDVTGPINAAADGTISMGELLGMIEETVGKRAVLHSETPKEHQSPYGLPSSWYMDTSKAKASGFVFSHLNDWLPQLIVHIADQLKRENG